MSTKPSPKASLYKTTGYHIEVDGEVFKSQGAAGYGGGDSTLSDKHRREVSALIVRAVNNHERLVNEIKSLISYLECMDTNHSPTDLPNRYEVDAVIAGTRALLSELEQE